MNQFPKWLYHAELPARIVKTPEEQIALGEGWADSPAAFEHKPEELPKPKKVRK